MGKEAEIDSQNVNTNAAIIQMGANGYLRVKSGDWLAKGAMLNTGGQFILDPGTTANLPGTANLTFAYLQEGGATLLAGGSTLSTDASKDVIFQDGGTLATVADAYGNCSASIYTSTLWLKGVDIYINFGATAHTSFGTLAVSGDVIWRTGTFHPFVQDGTANADLLDITGTLTFPADGTAAIAPTAIDAEWIPCMPSSGTTWKMIETSGGITTNNNSPTFTSTGIWNLDPILDLNNNLVGWKLKAQ